MNAPIQGRFASPAGSSRPMRVESAAARLLLTTAPRPPALWLPTATSSTPPPRTDEQLQRAGPGRGRQAAVDAVDAGRQGDGRHAAEEDTHGGPGGVVHQGAQATFAHGRSARIQRRHEHAEDHEGQHHGDIDGPRRGEEAAVEELAQAGEFLADQVRQHHPEQDRIGEEITPAERGGGHSHQVCQPGHAKDRFQSQSGPGQSDVATAYQGSCRPARK